MIQARTDGALLRRFDTEAAELTADRRRRFEAGGAMADREIEALTSLAEAIARDVSEWRDLASRLELSAALDPRRAGDLILETVFDEILAPTQWCVLATAFALCEPAP